MQWLKALPRKESKDKKPLREKNKLGGHKARTGDAIPLMPIGVAADMGFGIMAGCLP